MTHCLESGTSHLAVAVETPCSRPSFPPTLTTMGNNVSRRHHLLPQTWLEDFAQNGVLTCRRRSGGRDFPVSVIDATVVSQFYSNPVPEPGEDGQEVEKFLADNVEGPAAAVLQAIRAGRWPLAQDEETVLIRLLAHQLARSQASGSWASTWKTTCCRLSPGWRSRSTWMREPTSFSLLESESASWKESGATLPPSRNFLILAAICDNSSEWPIGRSRHWRTGR